jgi:hypothetical protein
VLIENSQGFKTFDLFKSFIRKLIQASYYFLKNFLENTMYQILFSFIQTYASLLAKE